MAPFLSKPELTPWFIFSKKAKIVSFDSLHITNEKFSLTSSLHEKNNIDIKTNAMRRPCLKLVIMFIFIYYCPICFF